MVYILAVIGMICWGVAPVFVKIGLKDINPLVGLSIRTFFTAGVIALWMIINGSIVELKNIPLKTFVLLAIEATLATLIGDLCYFSAVKRGSVSVVTLIMSSSPLVTVLCSVLLLGEKITVWRIVGACFIIMGITMII